MANILGKILRKQSPARIITTFNSPLPFPPLFNQIPDTNPSPFQPPPDLAPSADPQKLHPYPHSSNSLQFYPSFSLDFFLNPVPKNGFLQFDGDDDIVPGDPSTIWADSVKKKRKKKMNKHKLRKLRKRLRRKT